MAARPRHDDRVVSAAPLIVLGVLTGALAPAVGLFAAVLVIVPAAAALGRAGVEGSSPRLRPPDAAPGFPAALYGSVQAAAAPVVLLALASAPVLLLAHRLGAPQAGWRLAGAITCAGWLWHALLRPPGGDGVLVAARYALGEALAPLELRWPPTVRAAVFWGLCAALAGLVAAGAAVWWPLPLR